MKRRAAMTQRRVADAAPQAWRNGGGSTRELLAWPSNGEWQLRISVAEIAADGPFSSYEGVQRWFAVIEGSGVVLSFGGGEHERRPAGDALRFDGAEAPACRLIDGPTRDLNLMLRNGVRGTLQRAYADVPWEEAWGWRAAFTTGPARLQTAGVASIELGAGTLVYPLPPGRCRFDPRAAVAPIFWIGADLDVEPHPEAAPRFTAQGECPADGVR